jgi:hypothetical protein
VTKIFEGDIEESNFLHQLLHVLQEKLEAPRLHAYRCIFRAKRRMNVSLRISFKIFPQPLGSNILQIKK